jgi:hypothetical protein
MNYLCVIFNQKHFGPRFTSVTLIKTRGINGVWILYVYPLVSSENRQTASAEPSVSWRQCRCVNIILNDRVTDM